MAKAKIKTPKLTDKQKSALDAYISNPKITKTEAVIRSRYNAKNRKSASVVAAGLFNKPAALLYLEQAAETAQQTIVKLMQSDNPAIALKAAQDVLDRTAGKATQKTITEQQTVTITADFTGGAPAETGATPDSPDQTSKP